jgi:hypothetical protein
MIAGAILWFLSLGLIYALRSGNDQYFPVVRNVGQWGSFWQVPDVPILAGSVPMLGVISFGLGAGWLLTRRDDLGGGFLARVAGLFLLVAGASPILALLGGMVGLPAAVGVMLDLVSVLATVGGSVMAAVALLARSGPERLPALLLLLGSAAFLPVDPRTDLSGRMAPQVACLLALGVSWLWLGWLVRRAATRTQGSPG